MSDKRDHLRMTLRAQNVLKDLKRIADSQKAKILCGFFKTGPGEYGEGDRFLGIVVPKIRQIARKYRPLPLGEIKKLLRSPFHEARVLALLILVLRFFSSDEPARRRIYELYLKSIPYINNWDLVDLSAPQIAGGYLENRRKTALHALARSHNLWARRVAILATFHFIRHGHFSETFKIAALLLRDEEDLIHKAAGWMLREVGKRDLAAEEKFLGKYYRRMPRTMLRYAIERFPESRRQKYLRGLIP